MDILFICGVFPKDKEKQIFNKSKGDVQFAANALQWNIIRGLDKCNDTNINILNSIFIGSYPKNYKEVIIKSYKWHHAKGAEDNNVGFINIDGIKHLSRARRLSTFIKKWAKTDNLKQKVIVAYSAHTPFLYAVKKAKDVNPDIITCLIVPDLPQYMKLGENPGKIYSFFKSIDCKIINSLLKYIDSYVLLTKYMAEVLNIKEKPYIVMEGMVNKKESLQSCVDPMTFSKIKSILYTGTLNKKYGISTLLEAFSLIKNDNYRLWICGEGEATDDIIKMSALDPRIKFFGRVNRDKALQLQNKSTIVINPRNPEEEFTKFSFPSKNMEYLLSGRPTIAYKLSGIPDEYEKYIFFIDKNTVQSMAEKIVEVCEKSSQELSIFGTKAQKYILEEKNNIKQARRIIKMLEEITS